MKLRILLVDQSSKVLHETERDSTDEVIVTAGVIRWDNRYFAFKGKVHGEAAYEFVESKLVDLMEADG